MILKFSLRRLILKILKLKLKYNFKENKVILKSKILDSQLVIELIFKIKKYYS